MKHLQDCGNLSKSSPKHIAAYFAADDMPYNAVSVMRGGNEKRRYAAAVVPYFLMPRAKHLHSNSLRAYAGRKTLIPMPATSPINESYLREVPVSQDSSDDADVFAGCKVAEKVDAGSLDGLAQSIQKELAQIRGKNEQLPNLLC